jgi:hypothetical protein
MFINDTVSFLNETTAVVAETDYGAIALMSMLCVFLLLCCLGVCGGCAEQGKSSI